MTGHLKRLCQKVVLEGLKLKVTQWKKILSLSLKGNIKSLRYLLCTADRSRQKTPPMSYPNLPSAPLRAAAWIWFSHQCFLAWQASLSSHLRGFGSIPVLFHFLWKRGALGLCPVLFFPLFMPVESNIQTQGFGDLPDGPVAKALCSQCRGPGVQFLVRELDPTSCNSKISCAAVIEDPVCHN